MNIIKTVKKAAVNAYDSAKKNMESLEQERQHEKRVYNTEYNRQKYVMLKEKAKEDAKEHYSRKKKKGMFDLPDW